MKESNAGLKSNLKKADRHGVSQADYVDIPELPDEFFTEGQLYRDGKPVERRTRGKQKDPIKKQLTLRLNAEVVDFFRSKGSGWQSCINKALLEYMQTHKPA